MLAISLGLREGKHKREQQNYLRNKRTGMSVRALYCRVNPNKQCCENTGSLRISTENKENRRGGGGCSAEMCIILSGVKDLKSVYRQSTFEGVRAIFPLVLKNCNLKKGEKN